MKNDLPNDLTTIVGVLSTYQAELAACVVESTYNWYWLVDGLMEAGFAVRLAHTSAIPQYSGLKYSNDFSDARQLAHLLRLGILPTGYIYPKQERGIARPAASAPVTGAAEDPAPPEPAELDCAS